MGETKCRLLKIKELIEKQREKYVETIEVQKLHDKILKIIKEV